MSLKNKQNFETDYRWVGNFTRGRRKGNEHIYTFRNADTLDATQKREGISRSRQASRQREKCVGVGRRAMQLAGT